MKSIVKLSSLALAVSALCATSVALAGNVDQQGTLDGAGTFNKDVDKRLDSEADIFYFNDVSVEIDKAIDVRKDVEIRSDVEINGFRDDVNAAAMATVDNKQINLYNDDINTEVNNDAEFQIEDNSGNVGANVAAGDYNQQKNEVAVAATDAGDVFGLAEAEGFTYQNFEFNTTTNDFVFNRADGIIAGNSGNVGANMAAGTGNQQANIVVAAVTNGVLAEATSYVQQQIDYNWTTNNLVDNEAFLTVGTNTGNIGANVAAGVGNQQFNGLQIAVGQTGVNVGGLVGGN